MIKLLIGIQIIWAICLLIGVTCASCEQHEAGLFWLCSSSIIAFIFISMVLLGFAVEDHKNE